MSTNVTNSAQNVMQIINNTAPAQILDLDFVKEKFISNYNACNKEGGGELMFARNMVHMKQAIMNSKELQNADRFSIYACIVTAAANGYSLDPQDNEVYVIARGGKACLDRQAGAHVKRLIRTGQIKHAEQAKLVYEGDVFQVSNGRVIIHVENFQTDVIIACYVKMIKDDNGKDLHFVYRKSDWESWRKKSPNPYTKEKTGQHGAYLSESLWDNGIVNGTQPEPNFLRTKIIKHAAKEKCWSGGNNSPIVEAYSEVEIDTEDTPNGPVLTATLTEHIPQVNLPNYPTGTNQVDDNSFVKEKAPAENSGTIYEDDTF